MSIKYYAHFLVDEPGPRGLQEYRGIVDRLKAERIAHLEGFAELSPEIVKAVG